MLDLGLYSDSVDFKAPTFNCYVHYPLLRRPGQQCWKDNLDYQCDAVRGQYGRHCCDAGRKLELGQKPGELSARWIWDGRTRPRVQNVSLGLETVLLGDS